MTCAACTLALRDPRRNDFTVGCTSCKARALAATGGHEASEQAGRMTDDYKFALKQLFGDDWKLGHTEVTRWSSALKSAQARPPA